VAPTEVRSTINAVLIDPLPVAVRKMALDRAAAHVASMPDRGEAESGRRETAVADMLCGSVDGSMLLTAGAVDLRLEPEAAISKCREGQRVEHPPR
jgi:hypothetical protein